MVGRWPVRFVKMLFGPKIWDGDHTGGGESNEWKVKVKNKKGDNEWKVRNRAWGASVHVFCRRFGFMPPTFRALVDLSQQHVLTVVSMGLQSRASLLRIFLAKFGSHFGSSNFSSCQTRSPGCLHRYLKFIYGAQSLKWRQDHLFDLAPLSRGKRTGW